MGPDIRIKRYTGCMVNGYRFHTQSRENNRKSQNSGVVVKGGHGNNEINYYGVVQDIVEIDYLGEKRSVVVFKCDWFNSEPEKGLRIDKEWGIYSINLNSKWYKDQQYVLASQVNQVFYVPDIQLGGRWHIIQSFSPRNVFDVPENEHFGEVEEVYQEQGSNFTIVIDLPVCDPSLARGSMQLQQVDSVTVDRNDNGASSSRQKNVDDSFINDDSDNYDEFGQLESDEELLLDENIDSELE